MAAAIQHTQSGRHFRKSVCLCGSVSQRAQEDVNEKNKNKGANINVCKHPRNTHKQPDSR